MSDNIQNILAGISRQVFQYTERTIESARDASDNTTKRCRLSRAKGALEAVRSFSEHLPAYNVLMNQIDALWPKRRERDDEWIYRDDDFDDPAPIDHEDL